MLHKTPFVDVANSIYGNMLATTFLTSWVVRDIDFSGGVIIAITICHYTASILRYSIRYIVPSLLPSSINISIRDCTEHWHRKLLDTEIAVKLSLTGVSNKLEKCCLNQLVFLPGNIVTHWCQHLWVTKDTRCITDTKVHQLMFYKLII